MPVPAPVIDWLRNGIPLTLILDLAPEKGPDSHAIARTENATRERAPQK